MRYLCLINLSEERLAALPPEQMNELNRAHLEYNQQLRKSGHWIEAEALEPAAQTAMLHVRNGRPTVTDGPFTETKEQLAGFYLIEARDLNEAIQVATKLPSAPLGTVEVRPIRDLVVDGVAYKAANPSNL